MESNTPMNKTINLCAEDDARSDITDNQLTPDFSRKLYIADHNVVADTPVARVNFLSKTNITYPQNDENVSRTDVDRNLEKEGDKLNVAKSTESGSAFVSVSSVAETGVRSLVGSDFIRSVSPVTRVIVIDGSSPKQRMRGDLGNTSDIDSLEVASTSTVRLTPEPRVCENPQFTCQCGERFEKSVQLAAHRRWSCRLKENKARCEECNTWFASDQNLRRHMRQVHGGVSRCSACGVRLKNNIQLTRHWLDTHYPDGNDSSFPLKCYVCGSDNFKTKYDLECHWLKHKYEQRQRRQEKDLAPASNTAPGPNEPQSMASSATMTERLASSCTFNSLPHQKVHISPVSSIPHPPRPPAPGPHLHPWIMPPPPPPTHFPQNFYPHNFYPRPMGPFPRRFFHSNRPHMAHYPYPSTTHQENFPQLPHQIPRHDHEYVEPTSLPPGHKCGSHHHVPRLIQAFSPSGKMKWKKYLNLMMKGMVPPLYNTAVQHHRETESAVSQSAGATAQIIPPPGDNNDPSNHPVSCKFCEKIIKKCEISWHQRKECIVLIAHKCPTCLRVFRKRHMLLKHMFEQGHRRCGMAKRSNSQTEMDADTLLNLQRQMNDALNISKEDALTQDVTQKAQDVSSQVPGQLALTAAVATVVEQTPGCPQTVEKLSSLTPYSTESLECSVCKKRLETKDHLIKHLEDHLLHLQSIHKVYNWTVQSANFFHMAQSEDGGEAADVSSIADSEITSTTGSIFTGVSSAVSSPAPSTSLDPKWTKPHKKANSHHRHHHHRRHRKGEISVCDFCGAQFAYHKDLEKHIKAQHPGSKLQCPECHKTFSWKKHGKFYQRHLESHYGIRVYKHKCEHCEKTFLERSKLKAHVAALHTHELIHQCATCGKSYANKSSLVRHERKHTGARPHKCAICSESFHEKRELIRHSASHTGVNPFKCDYCGHSFTLKTSLTTHLKNKHPEHLSK